MGEPSFILILFHKLIEVFVYMIFFIKGRIQRILKKESIFFRVRMGGIISLFILLVIVLLLMFAVESFAMIVS